MAAKKRERPNDQSARLASSIEQASDGVAGNGRRLFSVGEYALLNVLFDTFLVIQLILVYVFVHETRGLFFFFGLLMVGFLLVSVFDYFYDRRVSPAGEA
jgi:hypothetical protein